MKSIVHTTTQTLLHYIQTPSNTSSHTNNKSFRSDDFHPKQHAAVAIFRPPYAHHRIQHHHHEKTDTQPCINYQHNSFPFKLETPSRTSQVQPRNNTKQPTSTPLICFGDRVHELLLQQRLGNDSAREYYAYLSVF